MIEGKCHCGAVTWQFDGVPEHATACNCTVCRRYGTLWAYGYQGEGIEISGDTTPYIRGDKELAFCFCPRCGCVTWWRGVEPDKEGRLRIAVNLRMAQPTEVATIPLYHFDGFDSWSSLPIRGDCVADLWA